MEEPPIFPHWSYAPRKRIRPRSFERYIPPLMPNHVVVDFFYYRSKTPVDGKKGFMALYHPVTKV